MKQARSEARQQARIKRLEKAAELQSALEDRAAARRLHQELAEMERDRIRYAARFRQAQVSGGAQERSGTAARPDRARVQPGIGQLAKGGLQWLIATRAGR